MRLLSAVTWVELVCVVEGRKGEPGGALLERFYQLAAPEIAAVTPARAAVAAGAFRKFGKGRHRAALNIGDCLSYALAAATGQPLLFKGDDFRHTDILPALPAAPAA